MNKYYAMIISTLIICATCAYGFYETKSPWIIIGVSLPPMLIISMLVGEENEKQKREVERLQKEEAKKEDS